MRLGSSLIGGKPMRVRDVVDVYQVGNQWIARSWPRPARQPNSPLQLLWRAKFTAAHALLSRFTGQYLTAWRSISCPPDRCWIDVAMRSILCSPSGILYVNQPDYTPTALVFDAGNPDFPLKIRFTKVVAPSDTVDIAYHWFLNYPLNSFDNLVRWDEAGWICSKGKRPKKRYKPIVRGAPYEFGHDFSKEIGNNLPVTRLSIYYFPDTLEDRARYAIDFPAISLPVVSA